MRVFLTIRPGHLEQIKQALKAIDADPGRSSKENNKVVGIHDQSMTLFDDETRLLWATTFDTQWEPYIADSLRLVGTTLHHYNVLKHCEGIQEGLEDTPPSIDWLKYVLAKARVTAFTYNRAFPDATLSDLYAALEAKAALEQVLDHPDAAEALAHPALKPLLDLASS